MSQTLSLDGSADGLVALGILKSNHASITTTNGPLAFDGVEGSAVVDSLINKYPVVAGQNESEKKEIAALRSKNLLPEELNKILTLRVYIADTVVPSIIDFVYFAKLRDVIEKQSAEERNLLNNLSRWFNFIQQVYAPEIAGIPISLNYTPPKPAEKGKADPKAKQTKGRQGQAKQPESKATGIARLLLQVGKIESIKVHETCPSLYVEEINVGEDKPRTVVSKLAEKIPIEEMQNRLVVVATNLLPATLQGVTSAGLVFCASKGDAVEVLNPPPGSVVGERVTIEGFVGEPDKDINRKVFSRAVKDLKTNGDRVASYQNIPLTTSAGVVTVPSLVDAEIK